MQSWRGGKLDFQVRSTSMMKVSNGMNRIVESKTNEQGDVLPVWSPRVKKKKIRQIYEDDARSIHDDDLLNDVGYSLLCRCESFIAANEACDGKVICPLCGGSVVRNETLQCKCGWQLPWRKYFKTIQHKQLRGAEDVIEPFREFISAFPRARNSPEKMILIDRLIHEFHGYLESIGTDEQDVRRPVGVNLIEGTMHDVVRFLNDLAYSTEGTPELVKTRAAWRRGNWHVQPKTRARRRG